MLYHYFDQTTNIYVWFNEWVCYDLTSNKELRGWFYILIYKQNFCKNITFFSPYPSPTHSSHLPQYPLFTLLFPQKFINKIYSIIGLNFTMRMNPNISLASSWTIFCISFAYLGHIISLSLAYLWHIFGISLAYLWHIFGISLVYLWHIFCIYLAYLLRISGYLWYIFGISLAYLYYIFSIYL